MQTTRYIAGLALVVTGCDGAFWGNMAVLGLTVGIFLGTLALGRARTDATRSGMTTTRSSGQS